MVMKLLAMEWNVIIGKWFSSSEIDFNDNRYWAVLIFHFRENSVAEEPIGLAKKMKEYRLEMKIRGKSQKRSGQFNGNEPCSAATAKDN